MAPKITPLLLPLWHVKQPFNLKTKVNNLGVSMNSFIFVAGALVGAYYNTTVLTVASACAETCTKGAQIILQLVA